MSITACLKVVFGEGKPKIIWTDQIGEHQYPSADVQNLAVFALLGGFFLSPEEGLPTSTDIKGLSGKYLGSKEDSYSTDGHPEGGVSLVGFTDDSVKNFLVSFYYNLSETEESEILSSSLSELNDTLIRNGLTEFTFHNSKTVLTIQRCSQQEISNLEQENPDFGEFVDAFDMVYQTLPNTVEVLEDSGFEVAKYKTNPDEILFRSECFLEETLLLDDGDSNKMSFLKFHQRILNKDLGQEIGIHYSVNDGEIEKFSFQTVTETSPSVSWEVLGVISNYQHGLGAILGYGSKAFGWETGLPEGLNGDYAFAFGANEEIIREVLEFGGMELPPELPLIEENFKLTYYPQSAVSNSSLDFDVFSLLINPSDYTPEDLKYFKELGIEPATKNADGSYTIHSTARILMPE